MATSTIKNPYRMAMEKVWENDDPSVAFASQTISVDLSEYVLCMLQFKTYNNSGNTDLTVPVTGYQWRAEMWTSTSQLYTRLATVRTNGVVFGGGYSNGSVDNLSLVPFRIYGIK